MDNVTLPLTHTYITLLHTHIIHNIFSIQPKASFTLILPLHLYYTIIDCPLPAFIAVHSVPPLPSS